MKVNRDIVAGSITAVGSARLPRVRSLPVASSANIGKIVYLTTDGRFYGSNGVEWTAITTDSVKNFFTLEGVLAGTVYNLDPEVDSVFSLVLCDATSGNIQINLPSSPSPTFETGKTYTFTRVDNQATSCNLVGNIVSAGSATSPLSLSNALAGSGYSSVTLMYVEDTDTWQVISSHNVSA